MSNNNETRNPTSDVGCEEQILLRVPPEVAKNIRKMIKTHSTEAIEFYFTGNCDYSLLKC
jgi:hypothetical protein